MTGQVILYELYYNTTCRTLPEMYKLRVYYLSQDIIMLAHKKENSSFLFVQVSIKCV